MFLFYNSLKTKGKKEKEETLGANREKKRKISTIPMTMGVKKEILCLSCGNS